jgi:hypothetical protein
MQVPVFLVWLVGLVLALVRWKRHPKVSLLTCIAFVMFFAEIPFFFYLYFYIDWMMLVPSTSLEFVSTVINIIESLISATAWGLLLVAVFGWRSEQGKTT